jgi:glutamate-1-semialdehyde 2,1-aminomutase
MPINAFGGRRDIMQCIAPLGSVYQAGTLSGSPVAVAAGLASLRVLDEAGFYERLEARTQRLVAGLQGAAQKADMPFTADALGGMFGVYFADAVPASFAEVTACDKDAFNRFFHAMLEAGHFFAPSAFEAGFVSIAHSEEDIDSTVEAAREVFAGM